MYLKRFTVGFLWERNLVYSNNEDYFNDERDAYCRDTPPEQRDPKVVCPTFQVPVGTGIGIFGGNGDIVRGNYIYDNWGDGVKLLFVPAASAANPKRVSTRRSTTRSPTTGWACGPTACATPNGNDFWWDEEGSGNRWSGNVGPGGEAPSSNVLTGLPACPGSSVCSPGVPTKTASRATCATWDPYENPDPPGCDWFTRPEEPR